VTEWPYLVPNYFSSAWNNPAAQGGSLTSSDLDWPRIGVYCPHESRPWLVGSLVLSGAVLAQRNESLWGWEKTFITGDGYLIRLEANRRSSAVQSVVDDAPYSREDERHLLGQHMDADQARKLLERIDHANATMRTRFVFDCGVCRAPRIFRSDSVQQVASAFWEAGTREVTISLLAEAVKRTRARTP